MTSEDKCNIDKDMDNHFIPKFYLSRWNKLIEYRRRRNSKILGKEVFPKATGYGVNLYANRGKSGDEAHAFELRFLGQHDDIAAKALEKLEKGENPNDKEMVGWISFLMALQMRHPDDIGSLRTSYRDKWLKETAYLQEDYSKFRDQHHPRNLLEYIDEQIPGYIEEAMFQLLSKLMQHRDIGQLIIEFQHSVTTLDSTVSLITSDRPLLTTPTLTEEDAYIILPIAPNKVYICAKSKNTIQRILNKSGEDLAQVINDQVARHATIAVYSSSYNLEQYVTDRIGKSNYESIFTRLSRIQN